MKIKTAKLKIGKHIITWRKGYMPECDCFLSQLLPIPCMHIYLIASRREVGDPNFLWKDEGGKL